MGMAAAAVAVMVILVTSIQTIGGVIDKPIESDSPAKSATALTLSSSSSASASASAPTALSYKTPLAYGSNKLGEKTGELVEQAIATGFRHFVTAGHHQKHNETGVGIGWKASGIPRNELFLQTSFIPFSESHQDFKKQPSDPEELPSTIEEQVRLSIQTSLTALQTDHIDALLFNNFRAKMWDTDEIVKAWKVLEDYVDKGVLGQLGLTSVHDVEWFERFYNSTRIKPTIIQNRFHSNRKYDVPMQETFAKHDIWVQRFWLLNGSSGMGIKNKDMAKIKGVTPAQLMLGFAMSMGSETCLVGTKSLQHMKDDVEIAKCYPALFFDDEERKEYAQKLGMKQPKDQPLPGRSGIDYGNDKTPKCQSTQEI